MDNHPIGVSWYQGHTESNKLISHFGFVPQARITGQYVRYETILLFSGSVTIARATVIYDSKPYHNFSKAAHVEDVVVSEDFRGQGVGKILMDEIKKRAKSHDCYKIVLTCSKENQAFYEKCGFFEHEVSMRCNLD